MSDNMKISYFVTGFPYKNKPFNKKYIGGGTRVVVDNLASVLAQKRHKISIFTTSADSKSEIEEYNGIKVYRYGTNFRVGSGRFSFGLLKNPVKYPTDLIHVHVSVPVSDTAGLRCAKKKNIPLVVTYHGDLQEDIGGFIRKMSIYFYNKYLLDKVLSYADIIISPSEYYINESRFLGKYRDKIAVIPNGINIDDFDIPYSKKECREKLGLPIDKNIVLFIGTLIPYKGANVLVNAMQMITKEVPDTEVVFVGGGGMRGELKMLSKRLGVEKCVKFAGFVKESLKPLYYRAADVFVLPSTLNTEVFPIVLLEASASGLPIVISDLDTFKCIIEDGYNGIITKKEDEKNLADAVIHLLENEDTKEKMGIYGRKRVEDYSWKLIAEETEKVYKECIVG